MSDPRGNPSKVDLPIGWGNDELSKFWQNARDNQLATFAHKPSEFKRLAAIDRAFQTVLKDWLNPDSEIATLLFLRCHSAYRAATGLGAAGQAVECFGVCRMALEFAGYAVHVYRNPSEGMVWLDRHKSPEALKAAKKHFQHVAIQASITAANRHAGKRFEDLYQLTIDYGAHPNQMSVVGHTTMVEENDRRLMNSVYLHDDGLALNMALKTSARVGVCALELLQCICNARFELLGVNAMMPFLKQGL